MASTDIQIDKDIEELLSTIQDKAPTYNLIVFNDDHHTMGQVVRQIIKAVKCTAEKAMQIMKEAHTTGQAIALSGTKEECEAAQRVLEEIKLRARIDSI